MNEGVSEQSHSPKAQRRITRRVAIAVLSCGLVAVVALLALSNPMHDFVAYWAAGHLLVEHRNPYSLGEVYQLQQRLGWNEKIPLMALNPPWTLPLFAPLGLANSYALAWTVWVTVLALCFALGSRMLMDEYFGNLRLPDISDTTLLRCLFAFTFYPVLISLKFAQTSSVLLLGVAGFLYFEKQEKPIWAGVFLSLTAIKPNVLYLVWLAVFARGVQTRRWKEIATAGGVVAGLTCIAVLLDPHALSQYWELARSPLAKVLLPGIPGLLRRLMGRHDAFWIQFAIPLLGTIWLALYLYKYRTKWTWSERMPALITGSLLTTGWAYMFDENLLALPIIALAATYARKHGHLPKNKVILYTVLNVILLLLALASSPWSFLPAPLLVAFLISRDWNPTRRHAALAGDAR